MKFLTCLLAVLLFSATGYAQGPSFNKPVYDPASKSYFELVPVTQAQAGAAKIGMVPETSWDKAVAFAAGRAYKSTKGRLAVVKSQETHEFLMQNLRPAYPAFIGLRYYCKERRLEWVTGETHPANGFKAWDQHWDQGDGKICLGATNGPWWMGVAYTSVGNGFRWVARGYMKHWTAYIVEYPTGHP
jgi:hypothetical protein